MPPTLTVNVNNICVFVLTNNDVETWFVKDERHSPFLYFERSKSRITVPTEVLSQQPEGVSLNRCIVTFGPKGSDFNAAPGFLDGHYTDHLADLQQIAPGARLDPDWHLDDRAALAPGMSAKVFLSGSGLTPKELRTAGGARDWRIGSRVVQRLTNDTTAERRLEAGVMPYIRIRNVDDGSLKEWPLEADEPGNFLLTLGSRDANGKADHELHMGVVFVTEFKAFDSLLKINAPTGLPIPHAYWPDYNGETDPDGGPCPLALLDLRTGPTAIVR